MNLRHVVEILNGPLIICTQRGVDLRLPAKGWDAVDVARVVGEIEGLPETPDRDNWSRRVQ